MSGIDMEKKGGRGAWIAEDVTTEKLRRNARGQNCKIIVVTGELFTGVDINALRGVHILEPFVSESSHKQAVGRASRAMGHAFLPEGQRDSTVYSYITRVSKDEGGKNIWGWNSNTMHNKRQNGMKKFVKHAGRYHPTKQFTPATQNKVVGGHELLQSHARKQRERGAANQSVNETGKNQHMVTNGKILYPTPDDTLSLERKYGEHTKAMKAFNRDFKNRINGSKGNRGGLKRKHSNI